MSVGPEITRLIHVYEKLREVMKVNEKISLTEGTFFLPYLTQSVIIVKKKVWLLWNRRKGSIFSRIKFY